MKNIIKSILFVVILFILCSLISCLLLPHETIRKYGLIKTSSYEILAENENTIDSVIIGDSLIYSGISPMEIWNEYGITTFDVAKSAELINESYKNIKVVINSQHPKVIFFESNVLYRESKNKPWFYIWQELYKTYFPLITYHNNWKKYLFTNFNDSLEFSKINTYKGYKYITKTVPGKKLNYMKEVNKEKSISKENKSYFDKIYKLCQDNNIKLILISTPNMKSWNYAKYLGTKKLAEEYNLTYIDLNVNNPLKIDWKTESRDAGSHLNYKGSLKLSHYIGEYLYNTGLFEDKRNDPSYASWNKAYDFYKKNID